MPMATTTPVPPPQQSEMINTGLHLPDGANSLPVATAQAPAQRTITGTPATPVPVPLPTYTGATMIPVSSPAPGSPGIMTPMPLTPGALTPGGTNPLQQQQIFHQQAAPQMNLQQTAILQHQAQQNGSFLQMPPQTPSTPTQSFTTGNMGPPPAPSQTKEKEVDEQYDPTDTLAGTGIDLREEEDHLAKMFNMSSTAAKGYHTLPPGTRNSMYGSGPMNQSAIQTSKGQDEYTSQITDQIYRDALERWEKTHVLEMHDPFLQIANVHYRANKIALDQGLGLNLEQKMNPNGPRPRNNAENVEPKLDVTTKTLPDGTAVVSSHVSFIPTEGNLADQMALLSLATKYRLKGLLEDSVRIALNRQAYSHGEVPEEWQTAATEPRTFRGDEGAAERDASNGQISAGQKRPVDATNPSESGPPTKLSKVTTNHVIQTVREAGRAEREWEERRLRRRNARLNGTSDASGSLSRSGSVGPGAGNGLVTLEKKDIIKKEPKRGSKMAEASHASQNMTSSMFAGLGSAGSLFGKKRKGKTYDWMNAGGSGAGNRNSPTPGKSGPGASSGTPAPLTTDTGRNRLGTWREDKEKGRHIQLRDLVLVLSEDGLDSRALQSALDKLDSSGPR